MIGRIKCIGLLMKLKEPSRTIFECIASVVTQERLNKIQVTTASLQQLTSVFAEKQSLADKTLLCLAGDLAVAGEANKNDDGVTVADAVKIYKKFINQQVNIEHDRNRVVGFIVDAALTDRETHVKLTDEEALASDKPVNISVAFVVWPYIDDLLTELLEKSANVESDIHGLINLSWEMSFDEFNLLVGSRNQFEGIVVTEDSEIEKYVNCLRVNGGTGKTDGDSEVYRLVTGENLAPMGGGLVTRPAAQVKGIVNVEEQQVVVALSKQDFRFITIEELKKIDIESKAKEIEQINESNETKGSHIEKNNVTPNIMKIKIVSDITDEVLTKAEVKASEIHTFISEELAKKSEEYVSQLSAKDAELKTVAEAQKAVEVSLEATNKNLEAAAKELEALKAERESEKAVAAFNARMLSLDEEFELNDEDRKIVAAQIKDLDEDKFVSWKGQFEVLAKEKNKAHKAALASEKEVKAEAKEEIVASVTDPLKNVPASTEVVPSSISFSDADTIAKFKDAFTLDKGVTITV